MGRRASLVEPHRCAAAGSRPKTPEGAAGAALPPLHTLPPPALSPPRADDALALATARPSARAQVVNKPLFVAARLIGFPLSYVAYARDRGALDARQLLLQAPLRLHGPLSVAHAAMYGLMIFWGYRMFFPRPADAAVARHKKPE
eukprot:scaffold99339_cov66-Phaeocystis_antarctica.AAC.3